jgi:hypothetical protein
LGSGSGHALGRFSRRRSREGVHLFAAPEETITIATLLKGGGQIAGYTSTLDSRSAFILFCHPDETYLVQCRASYDVTRTPPVTSNCYKLQ